MSRIVLTFKNNDKEKAIEDFLNNKVSPSGYIKELIWEVMNNGTITTILSKTEEPKQEVTKKDKPKVGGFR